ncbi:MAG TPA: ATP-binding cassette domain-containing protein [Ruminococcus sp.]|nr:ATP-binding cassette domain-containing protein [Ruminococcus sp.]
MEYILQTSDLCKNYGSAKILKNVSINVPKGSIYGFVGRNGAGKTTLIRVITGLHTPSSGSYSIFGVSNTDPSVNEKRAKIGAVVETPSIYPDLDARENLRMVCRLLGKPFDNIEEILKMVELANTGKKKAKNFSLGMRQRLGIAFSLINDPELLVLDEPINGLDPQGIMEMRELLTNLNQQRGITILISSHILDELSKLATHYGFIDRGVVLKEMSAEELHRSCQKSARITVDNMAALEEVLREMNLGYNVLTGTEAEIYGDFFVTPLVNELNKRNCIVQRLSQNDESLESFFINLIGGGVIA